MSVFNFLLLVTDYLMRRTTSGASNGVIGSFTNKLDDLDFPDDKALISSTIKQCQAIVNKLKEISAQTGLKDQYYENHDSKIQSQKQCSDKVGRRRNRGGETVHIFGINNGQVGWKC